MTNKTIGIIFALDAEIKNFISLVSNLQEKIVLNKTIYKGEYLNNTVVFSKVGLGKVNAGVVTGIIIENYNPDLIFNCGIGGGINKKLKTLDVVIAEKVIYSDVDMTGDLSGFKYGQLQGYPEYFETNKEILNSLKSLHLNAYFGTIISGDQFMTSREKVDFLLNNYFSEFDCLACDMESGAIRQVCYDAKIPSIIIRTISDVVGENNAIDYYKLMNTASDISLEVLKTVIEKL